MSALNNLLLQENLHMAWAKVRRYYITTDAWYDELAVAEFEANLESELTCIRDQFLRGTYSLSPLVPLPQPKKADPNGNPRVRQAFWVRVRDQVAWTAFANVIGPILEEKMPTWSYGNRLYRTVWYDTVDLHPVSRFGPFRSSDGLLYRRFQHSWPLYRRHIYLTIRAMSLKKYQTEIELSDADRRALRAEQQRTRRLPYLRNDFWKNPVRNPYWVSLDLEKFYPSLHTSTIASNIREHCQDTSDIAGTLLDDLLRFRVDPAGWSQGEMEKMRLKSKAADFPHIPTGLMVAGFLANVAMLQVPIFDRRPLECSQRQTPSCPYLSQSTKLLFPRKIGRWRRNRLFAGYLNHWRKSEGWKIRDLGRAAEACAALLRAPLFERAIHGGESLTRRAIALQAKRAASCLLVLLGSGCL
jgi:hypothetical protein